MSDDNDMLAFEFGTPSEEDQLHAFGKAYDVFRVRNATYRDLWKEDEIGGLVAHIQHKSKRVQRLAEDPLLTDNTIDDAIDLVNYSMFLLRMVLEKRDLPGASTVRN